MIEKIKNSLAHYQIPFMGLSLQEAKAIKACELLDNGQLQLLLHIDMPCHSLATHIEMELRELLATHHPSIQLKINIQKHIAVHKVQSSNAQLKPHKQVKNIIAVASGKGGVGKSTTTVNLALALQAEGASVGILDADIYGPSQGMMLDLKGRPDTRDGQTMEPLESYGLKVNSMAVLVNQEQPMIWRGPMVSSALEQLLNETQWRELDYLLIDLPPGTGDIQLTMSQKIPISGAVIVTTPQDIALMDAQRGLKMFEEVNVPVLGIIENMSTHICTQCGHEEHIFGEGGAQSMAEKSGSLLLASLPLDINIRQQADRGKPIVASDPEGDIALIYRAAALRMCGQLARRPKDFRASFGNIVIK